MISFVSLTLAMVCSLATMNTLTSDVSHDTAALSTPAQDADRAKKQFAFLSNRPGGSRDDNWDLYVANHDGSEVRRITNYNDISIRWVDKDPKRDRFVVAASTRGNLTVGPSGNDGRRDGPEDFIALIDMPGKMTVLIDTRPGGHNPNKLTGVWHPTFSPDGKEIVFSGAKRGKSMNLFRMKTKHKAQPTKLIDDPQRTYNDPRYSRDGRIVYVRHDQKGLAQVFRPNELDVWVMDPDDPESAKRMTNEANIVGDPRIEFDPALSPNGKKIITIRLIDPFPSLNFRSSNAVFDADGKSSDFHFAQAADNPDRVHGVPTWVDDQWVMSYRWDNVADGWRIIRFDATKSDGPVEQLDLGAPKGSRDLMPVSF